MSVIPCEQDAALRKQIEQFAEVLKTRAHTLGEHGLDEKSFYESALFRGAIESIRGTFSATMRPKREFVQHVLNHMQDGDFISDWDFTEDSNRNDYRVTMPSGKVAVIDLKGALDGNNTNIFERPADADEFILWSVSTNEGGDPRRNAWSGIHTRLSAEMVTRRQRVDGAIIWDMLCACSSRPCPKVRAEPEAPRLTAVGPFSVPPPCIYMFPAILPGADNPHTSGQPVTNIELLDAFHRCFQGRDAEVNFVGFNVEIRGEETLRRTTVMRGGSVQKQSKMAPIRRG
ncbi:hypothetical protein ACIPCF_17740 (plasmid) [Paracoccus marcusii]|uniref:hypothetical protein n=1 Tax=Paracoccus marcusii TaxID=59779 RepID=UPI0038BAC94D